jgi:hypothetical protein
MQESASTAQVCVLGSRYWRSGRSHRHPCRQRPTASRPQSGGADSCDPGMRHRHRFRSDSSSSGTRNWYRSGCIRICDSPELPRHAIALPQAVGHRATTEPCDTLDYRDFVSRFRSGGGRNRHRPSLGPIFSAVQYGRRQTLECRTRSPVNRDTTGLWNGIAAPERS